MNPMSVVHAFFLLVVGGLCVSAAPLDVFDPPVLTPNASTVWTVGQVTNITWDASNPPPTISNAGFVLLRKDSAITPIVLADNLNLLSGFVEITVPFVIQGSDYSIVLFGDSGNDSPGEFTINSPLQIDST